MFDDTFKTIMREGASRRSFLRNSGIGVAGIGATLAGTSPLASAAAPPNPGSKLTDVDIFNFALNFEYLGAEYYLAAIGAKPLPATLTSGPKGAVSGGVTLPSNPAVPFENEAIFYFAEQLAVDEYAHVSVIREVLGNKAVVEPAIDLVNSWTVLATAAGLIAPGQTFNPFASEVDFLLGAYVLEDTCVTALCGAAALIQSPTNLSYAASILGVEAYQVGMIRQRLSAIGAGAATNAISNLRSNLADEVFPLGVNGVNDFGTDANGNAFNFTNVDDNAQAFRRSFTQILAIAYGSGQVLANGQPRSSGLFFPTGVSGSINVTPF